VKNSVKFLFKVSMKI